MRTSRIGTAAFALGLSLAAGSHVTPANADTGDSVSPSVASVASGASGAPSTAAKPVRPGRMPARRADRPALAPATTPTAAAVARSQVAGPARREAAVTAKHGSYPSANAQARPPVPLGAAPAVGRWAASAGPAASAHVSASPSPRAVGPIAAATAMGSGSVCAACWGATAPTIGQAVSAAVNHLFNSAFDWLSTFPANPISDLIQGAFVLIRRALFFVPSGVSATQFGTALTVSVNTGSVAYFRQHGNSVQVSGDPSFLGARTFDATTVSTVAVSNPGNAGCAGLVVASGTATADLATNGIDALRFGSGAQFTGAVAATVTAGTLTVRDAVRGLSGVTLDAPVALGDSVEIDAGDGNATFTGTVDATKAGGQSLTVTALGDTTFQGAVGGQTALAGLLTRAVAPLDIQQSTDTKSIPLYYMPQYNAAGQLQVKYGIDVAVGSNAPRTFVFDTGGNGFWAGYDPAYWNGVPPGDIPAVITYTSGNRYNAVVTDAVVTIGPQGGPTISTAQPVEIGAILSGGNINTGQQFDFTNPYAPPVDGRFSGDFGAAFGVEPVTGQPSGGLTSVLFQLPGNLSSGYLVQLGPIGSDPQLTVGITDALRAQFPYAIPIAPLSGGGTYPVSGYQVLQQFGFSPQYYVTETDTGLLIPLGSADFQQCASQCLPSLIDSGAPSTSVRLPGAPTPYPLTTPDNPLQLREGAIFMAKFPTSQAQNRPALTWTFQSGTNGSVNEVNYAPVSGQAISSQNLNTGLNLYNDFDVMFDLKNQVIWLRPNGGQATVSLKSVTTTGAQSYQQNAELGGQYSTTNGAFSVSGVTNLTADTVIATGSGDVTFSGTVDANDAGRQSLTVNSSGATEFVRAIGSQRALSTLTADAGGSTETAGATTAGSQNYRDAAQLNGKYQVTTADATFTVAGPATLAGAVGIDTSGGDITFSGTVDGQKQQAFTLKLSTAGSGKAHLNGAVGGINPLGGLELFSSVVTAGGAINLNGSLGYAGSTGILIGDNVTVDFTASGSAITNFTTSGIVFQGASRNSKVSGFTITGNVYDGIQIAADGAATAHDYTGTEISGNAIYGNAAFGIETVVPVTGLTIANNTIGAAGTANQWDYVSDGPNTHGIVLAPGTYSRSSIAGNTITHNLRSGIFAPDGVQQLTISGNALSDNGLHGIEFANGDFTGTVVSGNTIESNVSTGISLGAGIGQGTTTGGDPLHGYTVPSATDGHYVLPYANSPDFYDTTKPPADPTIAMQIGSKNLAVNLDTGSRGLYFDKFQLDPNILSQGVSLGPGHVYLNSSNRVYFGTWVQVPLTFTSSFYQSAGGASDPTRRAVATIPVLVVEAIGATTTPMPGQTQDTTTFGTTVGTGTIAITDGTQTQQAVIVANPSGSAAAGTVTIPGGWYALYDANTYTDAATGQLVSKLAPVANFGVGFDRTGEGTAPTEDGLNQAYNAFLNLTEMRSGAMRPGYVISATGVTLGLDSGVTGFAYTDLAPTGLTQGTQTAPDWQPAAGAVDVTGTRYPTGPLVLDMGYGGGILTLPGYVPPAGFTKKLTVNLLNSGGAVRYDVTPTQDQYLHTNLLNPNGVSLFSPIAGTYSQNTPPQSLQFFNTGRNAFAAFQYLFDAAAGYLGLKVDSSGPARGALESAGGTFTADYYRNVNAPTGVTNLTIQDNTIAANGANGVAVTGSGSDGIKILSNSIYGNSGQGIVLDGGANGGQHAPSGVVAQLVTGNKVKVDGNIAGVGGYAGQFTLQVFASPAGEAGGKVFLGQLTNVAGTFTGLVDAGAVQPGDWITVTATPVSGKPNTSEFSPPAVAR